MNTDEKSDVSLLIDVLKDRTTRTGCSPCKESMQLRTGRRFARESGKIEETVKACPRKVWCVYIYYHNQHPPSFQAVHYPFTSEPDHSFEIYPLHYTSAVFRRVLVTKHPQRYHLISKLGISVSPFSHLRRV